jgi:alpha-N-acetylglucosaminidase
VHAWQKLYEAANSKPKLWTNPAYQHDMVDVTRQVMANAFIHLYQSLISSWNISDADSLSKTGKALVDFLGDLDTVLLTNGNFRLSSWIKLARSWADGDDDQASFLEYNARNQITLWGPNGEIADYASKQWSGLISSFYIPRWRIFIKYLKSTPPASYNSTEITGQLINFELKWQNETWDEPEPSADEEDLEKVLNGVCSRWATVFGRR